MNAVLTNHTEVLPPLTQVAQAVQSPGQTVIDNTTGSITFEHKSAGLLLAEANRDFEEASELVPLIDSDSMFVEAGDLLKRIVDSWKTLDEQRLATTKPLREQVDHINSAFMPAIERRKEAERTLKQGMAAFETKKEQERLRLEAENRRAIEEQRRRATEEARQAEAEAAAKIRKEREEAEQQATAARTDAESKAAAMRAEADELEAAGNDARAAQLRSEASELLGEADNAAQTVMFEAEQRSAATVIEASQTADSLRLAAQVMTPAAVTLAKPKAAGIGSRIVYSAEVTDPEALINHILENWDLLNHLISIDQGKVNRMAQDQKERFKLPGCELRQERQMSARRR